ncbi:hypothetical protein HNO88_002150 [Novosphingobium chloroacetimidivorans]|uniref:Lipoprotein n=1 Tax=Novosphingobium chloroacetimidivorans TaxID=1428314 RepID=A0A7W7K9R0_9SPHN|nr:hypothetical protein [Novosphingobium chloroacetimidivorans]MBB4858824.1 hypothetical protein [Novosphingobium chloroacetimidivorans]
MRLRRYVSLLGLALAACGGGSPGATASQAPVADQEQAAPDYAACRDAAGGTPSAMIACADAEIARVGSAVDSPEAAAAFQAALQQLGDAYAGPDGGQAAQVTFADRAVRLARRRAELLAGAVTGKAPLPSSGTPHPAWSRSRDLSCREHPVPRCAARYDALLALLDTPAKEAAMTRPAPASGLPLPTCAQLHAEGKVGSALADAFYARYPKSLAGEQSVEAMPLDAAALDNVVRYLACVAGATDYDPVVVENGLALFASKRHGAAALRALEDLGKSADPAAEAARRLHAQVRAYLDGTPG